MARIYKKDKRKKTLHWNGKGKAQITGKYAARLLQVQQSTIPEPVSVFTVSITTNLGVVAWHCCSCRMLLKWTTWRWLFIKQNTKKSLKYKFISHHLKIESKFSVSYSKRNKPKRKLYCILFVANWILLDSESVWLAGWPGRLSQCTCARLCTHSRIAKLLSKLVALIGQLPSWHFLGSTVNEDKCKLLCRKFVECHVKYFLFSSNWNIFFFRWHFFFFIPAHHFYCSGHKHVWFLIGKLYCLDVWLWPSLDWGLTWWV